MAVTGRLPSTAENHHDPNPQGNLLSKGKDFQGRIASALAEDADHREHGQDEFGHEFSLVTRRNAELPPHSRWPSSYAGIGGADAAFEWLDTAWRLRDDMSWMLTEFPALHPLRADPRFADLLHRMGAVLQQRASVNEIVG